MLSHPTPPAVTRYGNGGSIHPDKTCARRAGIAEGGQAAPWRLRVLNHITRVNIVDSAPLVCRVDTYPLRGWGRRQESRSILWFFCTQASLSSLSNMRRYGGGGGARASTVSRLLALFCPDSKQKSTTHAESRIHSSLDSKECLHWTFACRPQAELGKLRVRPTPHVFFRLEKTRLFYIKASNPRT